MGKLYEEEGSERRPNGSTDHDESREEDTDLAITDTAENSRDREANLVEATNLAAEHEVEEACEGQSNERPNEKGNEEAGDVHLQGNGEVIKSGQTGFTREDEELIENSPRSEDVPLKDDPQEEDFVRSGSSKDAEEESDRSSHQDVTKDLDSPDDDKRVEHAANKVDSIQSVSSIIQQELEPDSRFLDGQGMYPSGSMSFPDQDETPKQKSAGNVRLDERPGMKPGNGSLDRHAMDNEESTSLSNQDQQPVNVDALGERPVLVEEAKEIKASVNGAQGRKAEVADEVEEIEPSVSISLTGNPDPEVEFEASDNGALNEKVDGLEDGDSAAKDLSDAKEHESIEMMQGIAKDKTSEAVAFQSSDNKEQHESTPEIEINEELEKLEDDGTLRRRNTSSVTPQHGTSWNTSVNFSSVQGYLVDGTRSDYFFIEGKRSPSFKAHDDGGSPFPFRSVDGRRSPSPFSQNQIGHGHTKDSSPSASSSNRLEGQSEAREITSAQHEANSLSGHPAEYDFEKVVREQKTHDLVCPICGSCVTERIILRKRKRTLLGEEDARETKSREVKSGVVKQEENLQPDMPIDDTDDETWGCLACFSFFIRKDVRVRRMQKVVQLGAEGQQTLSTISSDILQEERWDRTPCLPLLPSFQWRSGKAEPELVEPLLKKSTSEGEIAPVIGGRIHEVALDDDDEEEISSISRAQNVRKQHILEGYMSMPGDSVEAQDSLGASLGVAKKQIAAVEPFVKVGEPSAKFLAEPREEAGWNCLPDSMVPAFSWGTTFPNYDAPLPLDEVKVFGAPAKSTEWEEITENVVEPAYFKGKGILVESSAVSINLQQSGGSDDEIARPEKQLQEGAGWNCLPESLLPTFSWGATFPTYDSPLPLDEVKDLGTPWQSRKENEIIEHAERADLKGKLVVDDSSSVLISSQPSEEIDDEAPGPFLVPMPQVAAEGASSSSVRDQGNDAVRTERNEVADVIQENLTSDDRERGTCNCLGLSLPAINWGFSARKTESEELVKPLLGESPAEEHISKEAVVAIQGDLAQAAEVGSASGGQVHEVPLDDDEEVELSLEDEVASKSGGRIFDVPLDDGGEEDSSISPSQDVRKENDSGEVQGEALNFSTGGGNEEIAAVQPNAASGEDLINVPTEEEPREKASCNCLPETLLPAFSWGTAFPTYDTPLPLDELDVWSTSRPALVSDVAAEEISPFHVGGEVQEGVPVVDVQHGTSSADDKERATYNCLTLALPAINWRFSQWNRDGGELRKPLLPGPVRDNEGLDTESADRLGDPCKGNLEQAAYETFHLNSGLTDTSPPESPCSSPLRRKVVTEGAHIEGIVTTTTNTITLSRTSEEKDEEIDSVDVEKHVSLFEASIQDGHLTKAEVKPVEAGFSDDSSAQLIYLGGQDPRRSSAEITDEWKQEHADYPQSSAFGQLQEPGEDEKSVRIFSVDEGRDEPEARQTDHGRGHFGPEVLVERSKHEERDTREEDIRGVVCNCCPLPFPTVAWSWQTTSKLTEETRYRLPASSTVVDDLRRPLLANDLPSTPSRATESTIITIDEETKVRLEEGNGGGRTVVEQAISNQEVEGDLGSPGQGTEILKSIVYGGLDVTLVSLGVVSSAAGADSKTLTVLAMGLANVFFGLVTFLSTVLSLYRNNRAEFQAQVGRSWALNGTLAAVSFLFFGVLAPITYGFSFRQSHVRDFKFAATCVVALVSVVLLGAAKARVTSKSAVAIISTLIGTGFVAAVIGYGTGSIIENLLEQWGFTSL